MVRLPPPNHPPPPSPKKTTPLTNPAKNHRCYGFQNGLVSFTPADQSVSKCLTNLHFTQDSACITTAGSSCEGPQTTIVSAHDSMLYGNHQISSDDSLAIQAAMDDAAATGLKWSDDTSNGPGYINFVHVADNGSGIRGIEIYNRNLC